MSKYKKTIQEAIKAELKKEGILDKIGDSVSGATSGIANVGRGVAGQYRLGQINSKINRGAKRLKKDWDDVENLVQDKAQKMQTSKNPSVAQMGGKVGANLKNLSQAVNQSIQQIEKLGASGAENEIGLKQADNPNVRPTHGFEKWIRSMGAHAPELDKRQYSNLLMVYMQLLKQGIDPSNVDPMQFFSNLKKDAQVKIPAAEKVQNSEQSTPSVQKPEIDQEDVDAQNQIDRFLKQKQAGFNQKMPVGSDKKLEPNKMKQILKLISQQIIKNREQKNQQMVPPEQKKDVVQQVSKWLNKMDPNKLKDIENKLISKNLLKTQEAPVLPTDKQPVLDQPMEPEQQLSPPQGEMEQEPLVAQEEEAEPFPLVKKAEEKPFPLTQKKDLSNLSPRQQTIRKLQNIKQPGKVPVGLNQQGEIQVGSSQTGQSALYQAKDKMGTRKNPNKKK